MLALVIKAAPLLVGVAFSVPPLKFSSAVGFALLTVTLFTVRVPFVSKLATPRVPAILAFAKSRPLVAVAVLGLVTVARPAPPPTLNKDTAPDVAAQLRASAFALTLPMFTVPPVTLSSPALVVAPRPMTIHSPALKEPPVMSMTPVAPLPRPMEAIPEVAARFMVPPESR